MFDYTLFGINTQLDRPFAIEKHTVFSYNRLLSLLKHDVSVWRYVSYHPFDFFEIHFRLCEDKVPNLVMYNKTSSSYACETVLEKCSKGLRNSYFVLQHAVQGLAYYSYYIGLVVMS